MVLKAQIEKWSIIWIFSATLSPYVIWFEAFKNLKNFKIQAQENNKVQLVEEMKYSSVPSAQMPPLPAL